MDKITPVDLAALAIPMTDPFPPDPNSTNGSKASRPDSNGHQGQSAKLPQEPEPQSLPSERLPQETRQDIRKAFYILLTVGLILGALTAGGVVWLMNRLDLIGVPDQQEQQL
jgi:hypothetical protein